MATGTLKWFNDVKGYGFIIPDTGGDDLFLHVSELEKAKIKRVNEGDVFSYDVQTRKGKSSATNVKRL